MWCRARGGGVSCAVVVLAVATAALTGCTAAGKGTAAQSGATGSLSPATSPSTTPPPTGKHPEDAWLPADAAVLADRPYGPDPAQRLDVYRPAGADDDPIIVMVHGGGWQRGDKAASGVVDNKVAHYLPLGYLFVSINYRLSPTADPVTQAADVATALAYTQQHATAWGGDPHRVVLMGHSAGANLVSLVAANPSFASRAGAGAWAGTVSLDSAAYNVVEIMQADHLPLYDPVFGHDRALWQAASPTLQLSGHPAPMLLVCGEARADACPQANTFTTAAQNLGARIQIDPVDLRHGDTDSQLGTPGALTQTVDAFLGSLGLRRTVRARGQGR